MMESGWIINYKGNKKMLLTEEEYDEMKEFIWRDNEFETEEHYFDIEKAREKLKEMGYNLSGGLNENKRQRR